MTILAALLTGVALLLWAALIAVFLNLHSSDAAGNGLAMVYAVVNTFVLWAVLLVLVIVAAAAGEGPRWMKAGALLLCAASCGAALGALQLMTARSGAHVQWPIIVPVLAPPLLLVFAVWAYVPAAHALASGTSVAVAIGLPLLALSAAPWPWVASEARRVAETRAANDAKSAAQQASERAAKRQEKLDKLARFTADTPLWEWLNLLDGDAELRARVLDGARRLPRRQADAETMLARGMSGPILEIAQLDLQATDSLCRGARAYLQERAANLRPTGDAPPFGVVAPRVEMLMPALEWLSTRMCDIGAEIEALDGAIRLYPAAPDRDSALSQLSRLR